MTFTEYERELDDVLNRLDRLIVHAEDARLTIARRLTDAFDKVHAVREEVRRLNKASPTR